MTTTVNQDFSKRITAMRFILACFVVLIHSEGSISEMDAIPITRFLIDFVKSGFFSVAVPMFFVISGYLFFVKDEGYFPMLQKKAHSIGIPFLFWPMASVIIYTILQHTPFISQFFEQSSFFFKRHNIINTFIAEAPDPEKQKTLFDGILMGGYVYQFWYVRNLIVLFILSPIFKFLFKKIPLATFITVLLCYLLSSFECFYFLDILGISRSILFFGIGYIFAKINLDTFFEKIDAIHPAEVAIVSILFASLVAIFKQTNFIEMANIFEKFDVFFMVFVCVYFSGRFARRKNAFSKLSSLSHYSMWIFCAHQPILMATFNKLTDRLLLPFITTSTISQLALFVIFFTRATICVLFLLFIGKILHRICPKVLAFVTGGRA